MKLVNKQAFEAYANAYAPLEACGLLIIKEGEESFFPAKNIALDKRHNFIIAPEDFAEAETQGEIIGIIHSHVLGAPKPSQADLVSCETHGVPWYLYSVEREQWHSFKPSGYKAPLVGREFKFGVLDCFTLVRDYYKQELSMYLPDYERWDEGAFKRGESLYEMHMEKWGFKPVKDLQKNDIILMQIGYNVPSHAAIYLGNNWMLHHLRNRLSSRDLFGGIYLKSAKLFCRYQG